MGICWFVSWFNDSIGLPLHPSKLAEVAERNQKTHNGQQNEKSYTLTHKCSYLSCIIKQKSYLHPLTLCYMEKIYTSIILSNNCADQSYFSNLCNYFVIA